MNTKLNKKHLFEIEIFSSIINVFTVAFGQFNASWLNKSSNIYKTNLPDPKLWISKGVESKWKKQQHYKYD